VEDKKYVGKDKLPDIFKKAIKRASSFSRERQFMFDRGGKRSCSNCLEKYNKYKEEDLLLGHCPYFSKYDEELSGGPCSNYT
jgi:hypothetical protein